MENGTVQKSLQKSQLPTWRAKRAIFLFKRDIFEFSRQRSIFKYASEMGDFGP